MCKKICTVFTWQEQQETTNQIVQNRPSLLDQIFWRGKELLHSNYTTRYISINVSVNIL